MNTRKEHSNQAVNQNPEVEYIASRLNSVMETYKKMVTAHCA